MYELNLSVHSKPDKRFLPFKDNNDNNYSEDRQTDISYITCWSYNSTSTLKKSTLKVDLCYFHADPIGSASLITDDEGYLLQEYHYDAFGSIIFSRGSDGNRYRFAGKEYDQETGLSYFGARFYDPITGRFISEDPVKADFSPITHNPYPYAGNNPYKYIDPNGEFLLIAAAVAGVIGGIHSGTGGTWEFDDFNWEKAFAGGVMAFTSVYSFGSSFGSGFGIEALGGTAGKGLFATGKIISGTLGIAGSSYGLVSTIMQIESGEGLTMGTGLGAIATFGLGQMINASMPTEDEAIARGLTGGHYTTQQIMTSLMSTGISMMVRSGVDGTNPSTDEILRSFGMSLGMTAVYAGASALDEAIFPQSHDTETLSATSEPAKSGNNPDNDSNVLNESAKKKQINTQNVNKKNITSPGEKTEIDIKNSSYDARYQQARKEYLKNNRDPYYFAKKYNVDVNDIIQGKYSGGMEPFYKDPVTYVVTGSVFAAKAVGALGIKAIVAKHPAHHYFKLFGKKLTHIQINIWREGVKGSAKAIRIPWPF